MKGKTMSDEDLASYEALAYKHAMRDYMRTGEVSIETKAFTRGWTVA
jgi:hypothetical protein